MFCWFLKEKGWVDKELLESKSVEEGSCLPKSTNPQKTHTGDQAVAENGDQEVSATQGTDGGAVVASTYYHQVLEPLFFESLNKDPKIRDFDNKELFENVPYLNGGLFEPKDKDYYKSEQKEPWDRINHQLIVPNDQIRKLIELFETYHFTIDESTSSEQEIGVDPEMMGRIFENFILNRSSTGSFYTPREIVDYMVETSLLELLKSKCGLSFEPDVEKQKLLDWVGMSILDLENRVRVFQREKVLLFSKVLNTEIAISSYLVAKLKGRRFNFLTKEFEHCNPHLESDLKVFQKLTHDEFEIKSQFVPAPNTIIVRQEDDRRQELVVPKVGLVLDIGGQEFITIWTVGLNETWILDTIFRVYKPKKIVKFQQKSLQNFLELVKYFQSIEKQYLIARLFGLYFEQQKISQLESLLQNQEFDKISWEDTAFLPSDEPPGPRISGVHEIYKDIIVKNSPFVKQTYKNNKIEGYIYRYVDSFPTNYEAQKIKEIKDILNSLKILDPACGSGAFPMGVLQKLTEIKHNLEPEKSLYQIKKEILQNSIYGVDIMTIAVEISRLRCWLSLVVDEDKSNPEPLPNLEFKFVCANSLVGVNKRLVFGISKAKGELAPDVLIGENDKAVQDIFTNYDVLGQALKKLQVIRTKNFEPGIDKHKLKNEWEAITKQVYELNNEKLKNKDKDAGEISKIIGWNPFEKDSADFFDPEWMFGETNFQLVIGNPPYVQLQSMDVEDKTLLRAQNYQTYQATGDLYQLFFERGWQTLKLNGILTYITSNKWMRAGYGKTTRDFFVKNTNPKMIIDLGANVFESATVDSNILIFQKAKNQGQTKATKATKSELEKGNPNFTTIHFDNSDGWFLGSKAEFALKQKIEAVGKPLKDWDVKINYGIKTGLNEAFIIDEAKRAELIATDPKSAEIIKPILRGRDIKRYGYEFANLYLIATFPSLSIDIENYPAIKEHLLSFGFEKLEQAGNKLPDGTKGRKDTGNKWFETQDQIAYHQEFEKEKVVYPETTQSNFFSYDSKGMFIDKTCFMLLGDNLKYILGILSSNLFKSTFRSLFAGITLGEQGFQLNKDYLEKFPIPTLDTLEKQALARRVEALVEEILAVKRGNSPLQRGGSEADGVFDETNKNTSPSLRSGTPQKENFDTTDLEHQIDTLVYQLYGLTEEEIAVVEGS